MNFNPKTPLSRPEFVALMAMLMATIAFSLDAMLPALPRIAAELTPEAANRAQLIVSFFVLGMGVGTIFAGPMSDSFGRKPVIAAGAVTYCAGAAMAWQAQTLEWLLVARLLQGFGAAGPRVVALAIIRDLYSGRAMAQMVSFVIIVFTLVPAIAPTFGAAVMALTGSWRGIFPSFIVFAVTGLAWLAFRQPETLPPAKRRPARLAPVWHATVEVLRHPVVRGTIMVQILAFAMLFANLSSVQMVFDQTFGLADSFHLWFGLIAVIGAGGGFLNARLVMRRGMRWVIEGALAGQVLISALFVGGAALGLLSGDVLFWAFLAWTGSVFATAGLTLGNINALALEPMGHIAGTAASVVSALGSIGAAVLAAPVGLAFDGTPMPVAAGVLLYGALALVLMKRLPHEHPRPI
ncbi:multidrug MFS transporter [Meridianimarinicoccus roseus]|uniref:Multidrug MFS transporter n=1 Tax=Meridianimarinicoccus roseus TaxID=2072018 RepID=A0A2V2LDD1_9RHOB|nr:multidrug effflux MFS transporter [Meridianimarinicoccus roseus]PWR03415.1 multidrug MFS transporter [Meridianimarinicoccus roseus]